MLIISRNSRTNLDANSPLSFMIRFHNALPLVFDIFSTVSNIFVQGVSQNLKTKILKRNGTKLKNVKIIEQDHFIDLGWFDFTLILIFGVIFFH